MRQLLRDVVSFATATGSMWDKWTGHLSHINQYRPLDESGSRYRAVALL